MKILALDTSTEVCSAALSFHGESLERIEIAPREHAQKILPMVEDLLREAQCQLNELDAIAVGCGPGSFVGVRIAVSVAQGLGLAAGLPVVPVSTLAALAQAGQASHVLVAQDARMGEVYSGAYQRDASGIMQSLGDERLLAPEKLGLPEGVSANWLGVGSAWNVYSEALSKLSSRLRTDRSAVHPRAVDIARLGVYGVDHGRARPAGEVFPVYLRDQVAKKPTKSP
jgi:tRNA threonylcarbamoyladenosine biosynthesis protein TsaB